MNPVRQLLALSASIGLTALLAMRPGLAHASDADPCPEGVEQVLRASGGTAGIEGELIAADCKPWQAVGATPVTAAVMAFRMKEPEDQRRHWDVTGVVALVDEATGRVRQARRFTIAEEALVTVDWDSLSIDPSPYPLSRRYTALGLRFNNRARPPRSYLAWEENQLTLLVPDGKTLRPVFSQFMQASRRSSEQADDWEYATLTLTLKPSRTSGWVDLILTDRGPPDGRPRQWKFVHGSTGYMASMTAGQVDPFWRSLSGGVTW